jgi:hypothetical protein
MREWRESRPAYISSVESTISRSALSSWAGTGNKRPDEAVDPWASSPTCPKRQHGENDTMPVMSSKKEKKREQKTKTLGDGVRLDPEPVAEPVPETFHEPFEEPFDEALPEPVPEIVPETVEVLPRRLSTELSQGQLKLNSSVNQRINSIPVLIRAQIQSKATRTKMPISNIAVMMI